MESFILALLGGLFVVMGSALGYVFLTLGGGFPSVSLIVQTLTGVAVFLGATIVVMSLMLFYRPEYHLAWGVVIMVLSVGSLTGTFASFGGFGISTIGTVLGILGGASAIVWRPGIGLRGSRPPGLQYRGCLSCGRPMPMDNAFCPWCGAAAAPAVTPPIGAGGPPMSPR